LISSARDTKRAVPKGGDPGDDLLYFYQWPAIIGHNQNWNNQGIGPATDAGQQQQRK